MRTIRVSEEVWQAIASHGKFGETEDDVLRRILKLPPQSTIDDSTKPSQIGRGRTPRRSFATQRMSANISNNQLQITFQDGTSRSWPLPDRSDKAEIKAVRDKAVAFAREHGGTIGQINAVKKTLTDNEYWTTK
jgi:negative regulator of replication initiation